ncbi:hypothetical protein AZE42_13804 [Rhizopogon vesiculosus]|uniref:Uncharacterized protein n=1 Tax=Rhizopogon vesiculosus TaxID=180088 RepID=A0A1J8PTV8_9AGAM|nr:hypothetical protein AZE42_13804 [Rhizopogon vesiculosus]
MITLEMVTLWSFVFKSCNLDPPMFVRSAKMRDILSVPAQFSTAPPGSLSVAALLLLDLRTVLEIDTNFIFKFSKTSPMHQVPMDFASCIR